MPESKDKIGEVGKIGGATEITTTKVTDAAAVKAYLVTKTGAKLADLNKQAWGKSEEIIGNAVKAHGATLEGYRNSGLG